MTAVDAFAQAFGLLAEPDRARLREHGREQTFAPGAVILEEGSNPRSVFVLTSGRATVEKSHLGYRVPVSELRPGELFGEVSYLDGSPASASVVAREPATVLVLEGIDELLVTDAALARDFYRSLAVVLAGRLRYGTEDRVAAAYAWG